MSRSVTSAMRAWINARPITGVGQPLAQGAYLKNTRSPADGAYTVISRTTSPQDMVAEDHAISLARMDCLVYAGTVDAAENGASALRSEFELLAGCPEPCGDTGLRVLVADNFSGPLYVPMPQDGGETYCFQVSADFAFAVT